MVKKFEDKFSRFDTIDERDVRTNTHTDTETPRDDMSRARASRRAAVSELWWRGLCDLFGDFPTHWWSWISSLYRLTLLSALLSLSATPSAINLQACLSNAEITSKLMNVASCVFHSQVLRDSSFLRPTFMNTLCHRNSQVLYYWSNEANYWQTWSIARPVFESRAILFLY